MHPRPSSTPTLILACLALAGLGLGCAKSTPEESPPAAEAASVSSGADEGAADENTVPDLEWDQERMTQLTRELADAMLAVRNSFRNDPINHNPDIGMRQSATEMNEILRNLDRHCRSLATQVERGATADETRGTARRIGTLLRDANQVGRRLTINAWTDERILPAMELINQIAPYYGRGPMFDTETMTLIDSGPNPNRRQQGQ